MLSCEMNRVKRTNLINELTCEYGANHRLFQNPSEDQPQKVAKINGPQSITQIADIPRPAVPNMIDGTELYPYSGESSEYDLDVPQIP